MNEQIINKVFYKLDKELIAKVRFFPFESRDTVKQNTLIILWKTLNKKYNGDGTEESIELFCKNYMTYSLIVSYKTYIKNKFKSIKRYDNIDNYNFTYNPEVKEHELKIDIAKYKNILTKNELLLIDIMLESGITIENFNKIRRQLGFSGRGIIRYHLNKIKEKITEYDENIAKKQI